MSNFSEGSSLIDAGFVEGISNCAGSWAGRINLICFYLLDTTGSHTWPLHSLEIVSKALLRKSRKIHSLLRFTSFIINEPAVLIYNCKHIRFKIHLLPHVLSWPRILHYASTRRVQQTNIAQCNYAAKDSQRCEGIAIWGNKVKTAFGEAGLGEKSSEFSAFSLLS